MNMMRFAFSRFLSMLLVMVGATALVLSAPISVCAVVGDSVYVNVPSPSGPYPVGTLEIRLVDNNRNDPFLRDGSKRELMVRLWYPALRADRCTAAPYTSPKVWAYLADLLHLPAPSVQTNSCWQAPALQGAHPVILASHGYTGLFTDYTFLFEDLASRGYVVASVAHTYETTVVQFPDGTLRTSVFGSHFAEDSLRMDDASLEFAMSARLGDLKFVTGELARLNRTGSPLAGRLDLSRVGVFGHSMGASTAMSSLRHLPSLKAAVLVDPIVFPTSSTRGSDKPVLLISEGREDWSESECEVWGNLRGARVAVVFRGAEHLTPSDAVWLGDSVPPLHVETGTMGQERTVAATRNYVAAFFEAHLLGKPGGLLLNGLSTEFADAAITTQAHSLCVRSPRSTAQKMHDPE